VAVYNGNFELKWVRQIASSDRSKGTGVAITETGEVYCTGEFEKSITYEDEQENDVTYTCVSSNCFYLQKYDKDGTLLWSNVNSGEESLDYLVSRSLTIDNQNNVYVSGDYGGDISFFPDTENIELSSTTNKDCYIFKLNPDGNFSWIYHLEAEFSTLNYDLNLTDKNEVFVTGIFSEALNFDPGNSDYTIDAGNAGYAYILKLSQCQADSSYSVASVCDSYVWNGVIYEDSGSYSYYDSGTDGCDSVAVLELEIMSDTDSYDAVSSCESYEWNGESYTESGLYEYHTANAVGCDSVAMLDLLIQAPSSSQESISSCEVYEWNGELYTESGQYDYHTENAAGCDSTAVLTLDISSDTESYESFSSCESYTWNGETYTESGLYDYHTDNAVGCDSTTTLDLTISDVTTSIATISSCEHYEWNEEVYTESGQYDFHASNSMDCDSIATLVLTILSSSTSEVSHSACSSYEWNGELYTESGTYEQLTTNVVGCDSTMMLNLTILEDTESYELRSSCEEYEWNGQLYTESGTYTYSTSNTVGCDSLASLELSILVASTSEEMIASCDVYTWNGETYTESGTYSYATENSAGCDSTAVLLLTISDVIEQYELLSLCEGDQIDLFGQLISSDTLISQSYISSAGCDSIQQYEVVTQPLSYGYIDTSVCESTVLEILGETINSAGAYEISSAVEGSCDSIYTIAVNWLPIYHETEAFYICPDDTLWLEGLAYTSDTAFTQVYTSVQACDSTSHIIIEQISLAEIEALVATAYNKIEGELLQISVPDGDWSEANWWNGTELLCASCASYSYTADESASIELELVYDNGCSVSTEIRIVLIAKEQEQAIYIPNVLSMDAQDELNGRFYIMSAEDLYYDIRIYDRWGNVVYSAEQIMTNNSEQGWTPDSALSQGVYVYMISLEKDTGVETYGGSITVLR